MFINKQILLLFYYYHMTQNVRLIVPKQILKT